MDDEFDPLLGSPDWLRADLGQLAAVEPPGDLHDRVRAAALAARSPGRPIGATAVSPVEGFRSVIADLAALIDSLAGSDWLASTVYSDWQVRDLVAHMIAVDRYMSTSLGFDDFVLPDGSENDHLAIADAVITELRSQPVVATVAEWRRVTDRLVGWLAAVDGATLDQRLAFHGLTPRLSSLLVIRMFEIWTHCDDIRRAIGLPAEAPGAAQLTAMTELAVRSIPLGMATSGRPQSGRTARIVLTGPGGGAWTQSLDVASPDPGPVDVSLVADAVDFCRLAAQRLSPDELVCQIFGNRALAGDLLVGAAVFAA